MEIWDYIADRDFSSLNQFTLKETETVFNGFRIFVKEEDQDRFIDEGLKLQNDYHKEIEKINDYEQNVYNKIVDNGGIPDNDPSFMVGKLSGETRDKMIKVVEKFFDPYTFETNKNKLRINNAENPMAKEDAVELSKALVPARKWMYHFLNTVGYYQRHHHYFISRDDMYAVNNLYSNEVAKVNGTTYVYFNIFAPWGRLGPGMIDADKISVQSLVLKYLNVNTKVLTHIAELIVKGFKSGGDYEDVVEAIDNYIHECEGLGLLRVVEQ